MQGIKIWYSTLWRKILGHKRLPGLSLYLVQYIVDSLVHTSERQSRSMTQGREWRVTYRRLPTLTLLCSHFSSYRCTKANFLMTLLHGTGLKLY